MRVNWILLRVSRKLNSSTLIKILNQKSTRVDEGARESTTAKVKRERELQLTPTLILQLLFSFWTEA
jgi:hypothetical protein